MFKREFHKKVISGLFKCNALQTTFVVFRVKMENRNELCLLKIRDKTEFLKDLICYEMMSVGH